MRLKAIRDSYEKLLATLNEAGVRLDASQKSNLDGFILAIESAVTDEKKKAVLKAKKLTEQKCEREFGMVFESIMKHTFENMELAGKIQDRVNALKESKRQTDKISDYLDMYVESICPDKLVVDYAKMKKLEQLNESLRDVLLVNDEAVASKKKQLEKNFKNEKSKLESEIAKMQVKLNESMEKAGKLNKKIKEYKASELLESKTKDLPVFEARKIKKHFAESSADEIERNFKKFYESIKKDTDDDAEKTLEAEVKSIIDDNDNEDVEKTKKANAKPKDDAEQADESEEFNTDEVVKVDENGDIQLDDNDIIDESKMMRWCQTAENY